MPLKVSVSLHCAECRKKVPIKGKTFSRHSRRYGTTSGIYLPDVYIVGEPNFDYDGGTKMTIERGFEFLGDGYMPEDDGGLVCSLDCATKRVGRVMNKGKDD